MVWLIFLLLILTGAESMGLSSKPVLTKKDIDEMMTSLANWGRWGKDDEIGTLNLITAEKRKAAAALVRDGVPCILEVNAEHPLVKPDAKNAAIIAARGTSLSLTGATWRPDCNWDGREGNKKLSPRRPQDTAAIVVQWNLSTLKLAQQFAHHGVGISGKQLKIRRSFNSYRCTLSLL
jgi:hypothetical protein